MDLTFATVFKIQCSKELQVNLRVLKVREAMPTDSKRAIRLHQWASQLWRRDLKVPVKPIRVKEEPSFLVPESAVEKCQGLTFQGVPNFTYHLDLTTEAVSVDPRESDLERREIVCNLVERSFTDRFLSLSEKFWRWQWTLFYRQTPENISESGRVVDAFRGLKFSVIWTDEAGLFLAADVRTKYIGCKPLSEYLRSGNTHDIDDHLRMSGPKEEDRYSNFIRDNRVVRFPCKYAGPANDTVSKNKFFDDALRKETTIQEYYKRRYAISLPADDPVVFVKDSEEKEAIRAPASRLFPAFDTEQLKKTFKNRSREVPRSQLAPHHRVEMVQEFLREIGTATFGDVTLTLTVAPSQSTRRYFIPPNLEFGEGFILRYGEHISPHEADQPTDRLITKWTQSKMPMLYRHGPFSGATLPRLVMVAPTTWAQSSREEFKRQLEAELTRQVKRQVQISEQRLYSDLKSAIDLLGLVSTPGTWTVYIVGLANNLPNWVHDQIKLKTQSSNRTQCFSETTFYKIAQVQNTSYARNLALAVLIDSGIQPWVLESALNYEAFVGVDILQNRAAFHYFWGESARRMDFVACPSSTQGRRQEAIKRPLMERYLEQGLIKIADDTERPLRSLTIHRDGRWWPSEQQALERTLHKLIQLKKVDTEIRVAVVEIHKTHIPVRLLSARVDEPSSLRYVNPVPGVFWVLNSTETLLACASKPIAWDDKNGRTAGTIILRIAWSRGPVNIEQIANDGYYLTQLNWSAPDIEINVPVTIRWADDKLRENLMRSDTDVDAVDQDEEEDRELDEEGDQI